MKGGGIEGQGPRSRRAKREEKRPDMAAITDAKDDMANMFAFTCTSDYTDIADALNIPKS